MIILKNVTVIVLLVATFAVNAAPVDDSLLCELKPTRQYGFFGIGFGEAKLNDLNSRLDLRGISSFDPASFNLSFGGHVEIRKLIRYDLG
jgi:hypothetical protein